MSHTCYICGSFASFICPTCNQYYCFHAHRRRRKVDGQWDAYCSQCADAIDVSRAKTKNLAKCVICGTTGQVEETTLIDANGIETKVLCCEQCYISGRVFHLERRA